MTVRLVIALGLACVSTAAVAVAQPVLLPIPPLEGQGTPAPCCPTTPLDEYGKPLAYDRSLLYLPDQHPNTNRPFESRPRDERATWGRVAYYLGQTESDWRSGVDGMVGLWWDQERSRGAELGTLYLAEGESQFANRALETRFFTAHADYRQNVGKVGPMKVDILGGYRFASVGEDWNRINTGNQYHGATIGLGGELRHGPWSVESRASVALGVTFAKWNQQGDRVFSSLPEVALTIGREVLDGSRLFVGYRLAYIDRIARPGRAFGQYSRFNTQGIMLGFDWWF